MWRGSYVGKSTRKTSKSGGCGVSGVRQQTSTSGGKSQKPASITCTRDAIRPRRSMATSKSNAPESKVVEIAKWTVLLVTSTRDGGCWANAVIA
jgi:hypothetical protein